MDDEGVHHLLLQVVGVKHSYSLQRQLMAMKLSPRDDRLADLEEEALSAILKFKRSHELMMKGR